MLRTLTLLIVVSSLCELCAQDALAITDDGDGTSTVSVTDDLTVGAGVTVGEAGAAAWTVVAREGNLEVRPAGSSAAVATFTGDGDIMLAGKLISAVGSPYSWMERHADSALRVERTPAAPGDYRVQYKSAGSNTSAKTDTEPLAQWALNAADGVRIKRVHYQSAGQAGVPNWWQFYIGHGSTATVRFYKSTGRQGSIDTRPIVRAGTGVEMAGVYEFNLSDQDGTIVIDAIKVMISASGGGWVGLGEDSSLRGDGYFDIIVHPKTW